MKKTKMKFRKKILKEIRKDLKIVNPITGNTLVLGRYIGKYIIVRSRNEGINAGIVKAIDGTGVILSEARRLWYHKPKDKTTSWYEGVSQNGLSGDSKISTPVIEKAIIEDYSVTLCTDVAKKSISSHKTTETT